MISTNEKSNTVSFTTSEVFNIDNLSNLSNQPRIDGRLSAALEIDHGFGNASLFSPFERIG